ncbi:MAG TPA: arginine--tRNA ligase [Candidatus Binataceae bacterium]|nr:arginine--tRNA ligase [Candidatus Binataceae bacterium]
MKDLIGSVLKAAIARAHAGGKLASAEAVIVVEAPKDAAHGDAASNAALTMAKREGKPPRVIAETLKAAIEAELPDEIQEVSVAGPGFINFRMAPEYWHGELRRAAARGREFVRPAIGNGRRVQVEFLSANPTGPLTVGHGRNAVLGDAIGRLLEASGYEVTREYYFNDGGRQMKLLGESVRVRYMQELGREAALPQDGYEGEYIRTIAQDLRQKYGDDLAGARDRDFFCAAAVEAIFAEIKQTCERLRVCFDHFTNERELMDYGRVDSVLAELAKRDLVTDKDGAVWLRGEPLGLPKDVVLVRSGETREPTYRTPDIAYHIEKLKAGYDLIVDVFGADHIAEHQQVIAAVKALGYETAPIRAIIYQFVTLTRGGEKVKMSTRKATYVTLDELIEEAGADVVRFFFLFRKHDSHLDFDLDLAKKQAPENPVYYVQYAHARLASVFREAEARGLRLPEGWLSDRAIVNLELLGAEEIELAKRAVGMTQTVADAAMALEPHRVPFYLLEVAGEFHRYYNKPANRIIGDDRELSLARLFLAHVLKECIAGGLDLLGVNAPERM